MATIYSGAANLFRRDRRMSRIDKNADADSQQICDGVDKSYHISADRGEPGVSDWLRWSPAPSREGVREVDIDPTVPNPARVYNYLLGGKDHFEADRATAKAG